MKILNLYKYILLVICGLQSVTLAAQGFDDDRAINNVLTMRVKMLDEFFQRFNREIHGTCISAGEFRFRFVGKDGYGNEGSGNDDSIPGKSTKREIGGKSGCKGIP